MSPGGLFAGESDRTVGTGPRSATDARRQPAGPPSNSRPTAVPHTASSSDHRVLPRPAPVHETVRTAPDPGNRRAMLRAPATRTGWSGHGGRVAESRTRVKGELAEAVPSPVARAPPGAAAEPSAASSPWSSRSTFRCSRWLRSGRTSSACGARASIRCARTWRASRLPWPTRSSPAGRGRATSCWTRSAAVARPRSRPAPRGASASATTSTRSPTSSPRPRSTRRARPRAGRA